MNVRLNFRKEIELGHKSFEIRVKNGNTETLGRLLVGNKHLAWLPKGHKIKPLKKITWTELISVFTA